MLAALKILFIATTLFVEIFRLTSNDRVHEDDHDKVEPGDTSLGQFPIEAHPKESVCPLELQLSKWSTCG